MSGPRARRARASLPSREEVDELRQRLAEAEETIQAIRTGAVDAFLIEDAAGARVYTLDAADRPYRVLVECMQEGALLLSPDGTVLFCNRRLADMLGVAPEQVPSTNLADYLPAAMRESLAALLVPDDIPRRSELLFNRRDGTQLPVHMTVNPLPLEGEPTLCAIVSDLTGLKQLEELERSQHALRDLERRKDEFLAVLAHELRSPLTPLRNGLQIMEMAQRDPRMLASAQGMMKRQLQRMVTLIDDLIDVSRITVGRLELNRETLDIADVVRHAAGLAGPVLAERAHELVLDLPETPLLVDGDLARLTQVLSGLIGNASKFSGRGARIALAVARDGAMVSVRVRDSGVGIPADLLPHVFDLFAQAEPAPDRPQAGRGVGLSIAQRLVEMHGGTIQAYSAGPGRGSEFTMRLPLAEAPAPARRRPDPPTSRPPGAVRTVVARDRKRILVADDNVDSARSLAQLLTLTGHDVRTAYRGSDAYELADWFRPHVALLDLGMPGGNGLDVCRRIRQQPWGRTMTLIALTAWGQPSHHTASREAGFEHHFVKPIDPAELTALLEQLPPSSDLRENPTG